MSKKNRKIVTLVLTALVAFIVTFTFKKMNQGKEPSSTPAALPQTPTEAATSRASVSAPIQTVEDEDLRKAVELRDSGLYEEAEKILKDILAKEPENILAIRELVTLYHTGRPNYDEALRLEEKLLTVEKAKPQEFDRYRELARLAKKQDRAITFLDQLQPAHPAIAYMIPKSIGQLHDEKGEPAKAIEKYREALSLPNDKTAPIHELIATSQLKLKNYKDAQTSLEEVLDNAKTYNETEGRHVKDQISTRETELRLIDVYLNNGQYQKALTLTNELLKTDSQNKSLKTYQEMATMGLNQGKRAAN